LVPGGTFYRNYDGVTYTDMSYPATVNDFYLDKYEITVGRFRAFVNAGMGTQANPPAPGAGAHPLITGSGWDSMWNTNLPADTAGLETAISCYSSFQTWTDTAGSNESRPMNCLDWYTAFAFCAWDGGRLPTEAEWNYAASGGNEQRYYPWSDPPTSTTVDDSYAVYCGGSCNSTQNVGSKSPKGDGKWGQCDLAGNVHEWTLDWYDTYQMPCDNCADITDTSASFRVLRGGSFYYGASNLRSALRDDIYPLYDDNGLGVRCARTNNGTGTGSSDAGVPDAPSVQPDVPLGGYDSAADGGLSRSCTGLPPTCGPSGNDDCCTSLLVQGGTFDRSYDDLDFTDPNYPATVSDFYLDKYEVTVGRFRAFLNAGMGTQANPPAPGAGANPLIAGSGWDSTWNASLPKDTTSLMQAMDDCGGNWTDRPVSNESQPENCLDWYTAFAFCAWDGGRLATEAEWNYAASGGNEQRYYPWSNPPTSTTIDDSYAVYCGGSCGGTQNVGSKSPKGDGKWGQSDLAGNVWEWTLDWYTEPYAMPCDNCAYLTEASGSCPVIRGGVFDEGPSYLRSAFREVSSLGPSGRYFTIGVRCARSASQ
jgi:formylglycine-generating enzyme required for sulfatase activity